MYPASIADNASTPNPAIPYSLPAYLTPLVGRAREVKSLSQLLRRADVRLVTLTGPGGVGKTRLALDLAANLAADFPAGVCFVSLDTVQDAELLLATITRALGLQDSGGAPLAQLAEHLRERGPLLLLDNFEQLVATAPLITELLAACQHLKVLVTSRAVLRVRGEYEFPVLPLALPPAVEEERSADQDPIHYAAVALFVQCVQAVRTDFALSAADYSTIAEICRRLDGLPLAIELAAARVKLLTLPTLLARLGGSRQGSPNAGRGSQLGILTTGARDVPARQQTMRQTIAWSYDLLATAEQLAFRFLSVFVDGCSLEAAEAVLATSLPSADQAETPPALDLLTALIDNSLARQVEPAAHGDLPGAAPRLVMSDTIREYGLERLEEAGEAPAARQAHASYYLALVEEAAAQLRSPAAPEWVVRLQSEHDNLRAGLGWALEQGDAVTLLRLTAALWRFWRMRGYLSEGRRWLEAALTASESATATADLALRVRVLNGATVLAHYQSDYLRAKALSAECVGLCRHLDDKAGLAEALKAEALVARVEGDSARARALYRQARVLHEQLGDRRGVAETLYNEAVELYLQGEFAEALALSRQSLASAGGDLPATANALGVMSIALIELGDYATAQRVIQDEALPLLIALGDRGGLARCLNNLGRIDIAMEDCVAAQGFFEQSLAIHREMGDQVHVANSLSGLARVAMGQGQLRRAVRLSGTVQALREAFLGSRLAAGRSHYLFDHIPFLHKARALLGEAEYGALLAEGHALTVGQALTGFYSAADEPHVQPLPAVAPVGRSTPPASRSNDLTEREVEVLRLIARGLSKPQVAAHLSISPHTVAAHLRSIYDKLGVTSRHAAMRYALDHGLT